MSSALSSLEIEIYKALSSEEPRTMTDVTNAVGKSRSGCGSRMDLLVERGFLTKTKTHTNGSTKRFYTLTDLFSIAYTKQTGEKTDISESAKAALWMRSNRLAKGVI